jgi:hypothetical protein
MVPFCAIQKYSKHVVSSVAEDKFSALFVNAKEGTVTRTTLA